MITPQQHIDDYGEAEIYDLNASDKNIFESCKIDLTKKPKRFQPLVEIKGHVLMSRCGISAIQGKAKSRKSTLISLLCQKFLTETNYSILLVDTEMAEYYVHKNVLRVHNLMGWSITNNNPRYNVLQFRGMSTDKRFEMFSKAVEAFKPDLIFLDGVRDLLVDFNSIEESNKVKDELQSITEKYKCHICCILHENKADGNMRGHLGTEILNKAETVIGVVNSGETSQAEAKATRNTSFDCFDFGINKQTGLPEFLCSGMIGQPFIHEQVDIDINHHIQPNTNFINQTDDSMPF